MRIYRLVLFLLLLTCAHTLSAQTRPVTPAENENQRVDVDHADVLEIRQDGRTIIQRLVGNVELSQDSIYMYCDSAELENEIRLFAYGDVVIQQGDSLAAFSRRLFYHAERLEADLEEDVVLVNGTRELYTDRLKYDLNTKIATYTTGATLTDGETQLRSQRGQYFVDERRVFFQDSVVVVNPEFEMRADSLRYDAGNEIVYFIGPTAIRTDTSLIYCESGFYDIRNQKAEFRQNAQFTRGEQQASAKVIRYEGETETYTLDGRARFAEGDNRLAIGERIRYDGINDITELEGTEEELAYCRESTRDIRGKEILYDAKQESYQTRGGRSVVSDPPNILAADTLDYRKSLGLGIASGNVIWQDTSADLTIRSARLDYRDTDGYLKASGGLRGRPLLITLLDGDSLYVTADTLSSLRTDSLAGDSSRLLLAYRDVRILGTELQALSDSLSYNTLDSNFVLYREPIIWSDTSQFTADTIRMRLRNEQLDRIYLDRNAFILNSPDEKFFNQIKGKNIVAHFDSNELRRMDVTGNAEAVYYALDEDGAYIGVNKTACSAMRFYFGNNEIEGILFLDAPSGKLDPMNMADHKALRLEGPAWQPKIRPKTMDNLFGPPPRKRAPAAGGSPPVDTQDPAEAPATPPNGTPELAPQTKSEEG